jgi:hypothetical protein
MEQAAEILKHVETPLQLAALGLLALYAITKALIATKRWTPSDAIIKVLLDRAFALGMIALVLAVGGPLLLRAFDRDDLIDGSVYAQDGSPIREAAVTAPPVGRQPVHSDGSFELRVPDHLRRERYTVTASADGFKPATRTVGKAEIGAVDFQLQPQPEHAVRQILPELVVGQFYGVPFLIVSMQTKSPTNAQSWVSEVTAVLSNGQVNVSLFPQFVTTLSNMGPYLAVTGLVPINPGILTTIRFIMAPNANINGLVSSISSLPDQHGIAPCTPSGTGSRSPLSDQAFGMVEAFARSKFIWTEGKWTLHFTVTAADQQDSFDKTFELSAADVQGLWDSVKLVKSCLSINGMSPLAQDGAMSNYLLR